MPWNSSFMHLDMFYNFKNQNIRKPLNYCLILALLIFFHCYFFLRQEECSILHLQPDWCPLPGAIGGILALSHALFHVQKRGWHRAPWPPSGAGTALECFPGSQAPFPCLELPPASSTQSLITAFLYLTLWWLCLPGAELQMPILSSACARGCLKARNGSLAFSWDTGW